MADFNHADAEKTFCVTASITLSTAVEVSIVSLKCGSECMVKTLIRMAGEWSPRLSGASAIVVGLMQQAAPNP